MGIFGKLAFWKKKDEFDDLGLGKGDDMGMPDLGMGGDTGMGMQAQGMGHESYGHEQFSPSPGQRAPSYASSPYQPSFQQQPFQQSYPQQPSYGDAGAGKDIEVISSKLDALRALMDSINQRLANLEHIARGEEEDRRQRKW